MTRFARGLKCGCLGASGSAGSPGAAALPAERLRERSEPRAIEPSPTRHWRKNQRRVRYSRWSQAACWRRSMVIASLLGDRLVEVQDHARHDGHGRELRGRRALRQLRRLVALAGRQLERARPPLREARARALEEPEERLFLLGSRLAGETAAEAPGDAVAVALPALRERAERERLRALHGERLVEGGERLERRVRAQPPHAGEVAVGRVEGLEHGI